MFPPVPEVPDTQRATGTYPIRFEDLAEDGRVHFEPIVASIDAAIWRPMLGKQAMARALHASGVRPIFTRLALEVGPARLELGATLTADGVYELSHEPDGRGGATRLFLNMWTTIWAAPNKHRAERASVGRLFAEHQLTRPHAPPGERRVVRLPGGEPLPRAEYRAPRHESLLDIAPGHEWLEPEVRTDAMPIRFGLSHTDVNQHVNSLVYPRLFVDAALRRFAGLGESTRTLASRLHIAFRKPFFAGEAAQIELRAYREADPSSAAREPGQELAAVGTFRPVGDAQSAEPPVKPHVYVHLGFSRTPHP
jgi:hypothetical protein